MNNKYDVIIIGGGPAGLGSAINLAKKGVSVLLVEQNKLTETSKTWLTFDYTVKKYGLEDCIRNKFSDISFSCYLGSSYKFKKKDFIYPIYEEKALGILADTARSHGAVIKDNEPFINYIPGPGNRSITINTSNGSYKSKLAIDAMGRNSTILQSNGLYNDTLDMGCLAYFIDDADHKNNNELLLFDSFFPGLDYFWIVPLEDNKVMAGLFFFDRITPANMKSKSEQLDRYIKAKKLGGTVYEKRVGNIPLGNQRHMLTGNFLSIGDSCNTPLPSSGFSFNRCLDESEVLADFVTNRFKRNTDLADYKKEILGNKIPAIEVHLLISDLLSKETNPLLNKAVGAMNRLKEEFLISFLNGTDMSINFSVTALRAIITTYSLAELRSMSLKQNYLKNILNLYNLAPAIQSAQIGGQLKDFIVKLIKDI
jgi:digeranylgeranylglycerophospholipid reductase